MNIILDYHIYKSRSHSTSNILREPIVLIHGLGGNHNIFKKQIDSYREQYDVLAINLPGHGDSPHTLSFDRPFTFDVAVHTIIKTMDKLHIKKAHFVGISLGSIVLHHILQKEPGRVKSAVLGGGVTEFSPFAKTLLGLGGLVKKISPHMWLYTLFAHIMMPKKNHKVSRGFFIREAMKMKREDFLSWYNLMHDVRSTYNDVQKNSKNIPKFYISGAEDHLFIDAILFDTYTDPSAQHLVIDECGHVCNIEKPKEFNEASLAFIDKHKST